VNRWTRPVSIPYWLAFYIAVLFVLNALNGLATLAECVGIKP
jgi:hypothetical protein